MKEIKAKIWYDIVNIIGDEVIAINNYMFSDLNHLLKEFINYNSNVNFFTFTLSNILENYGKEQTI